MKGIRVYAEGGIGVVSLESKSSMFTNKYIFHSRFVVCS